MTVTTQLYAIHQPNFFPWLGYFDRIRQVDTFIFFDHVQREGGRTISQRVKVNGPKEPVWITMPLAKTGRLGERLCETEMQGPQENYSKILDKLRNYYRRAPYYRDTLQLLTDLTPTTHLLATYNRHVIETLAELLECNTTFTSCSDQPKLMESEARRTDMIVETCQAFGVARYMSGKGCLEFLDVDSFSQNEIDLQFQEFTHPTYVQSGGRDFQPGLSVIDTLFNLGVEGTRGILHG
jgi:hypothetical protein